MEVVLLYHSDVTESDTAEDVALNSVGLYILSRNGAASTVVGIYILLSVRCSKHGICYGWLGDCHSQYSIKTTKPILKFFRPSGSPIISAFVTLAPIPNSKGSPFIRVLNTWEWENWQFSTDIAIYLGNGYYGTLIGSHGCRIEWYNFWWPSVTPNPGFKVTVYLQVEYQELCILGTKLLKNTNRKPHTIYRMVPLSMTLSDLWPDFKVTTFIDIEYLRNNTRYSHSYYRTLVESHMHSYCMVTFPMTLTDP